MTFLVLMPDKTLNSQSPYLAALGISSMVEASCFLVS